MNGNIRVGAAVRQPLCSYYSPDAASLRQEIEWCRQYYHDIDNRNEKFPYIDNDEPSSVSSNFVRCVPTILLVPHGAYCDSGPLVAHAFRRYLLPIHATGNNVPSAPMRTGAQPSLIHKAPPISVVRGSPAVAETPTATASEVVVLLIGTEHASASRHLVCCSDYSEWSTPLGSVATDFDLLGDLMNSRSLNLPADNCAFAAEHSVENQLPFLQVELEGRQWTMVALSVRGNVDRSEPKEIQMVGRHLAEALVRRCSKTNVQVAVIATTDYTHAGPFYGELPPPGHQSIPDYIRSRDLPFLYFLCSGDNVGDRDTHPEDGLRGQWPHQQHRRQLPSATEVWERGRRISMCGLGATLLALEVARNLDRTRAQCIKYAVGSDVCHRALQDQTGFATVAFL